MADLTLVECDDCERRFHVEKGKPVKHLEMRVDPGGPMPSCECPWCGALAYPVLRKRRADAVLDDLSTG